MIKDYLNHYHPTILREFKEFKQNLKSQACTDSLAAFVYSRACSLKDEKWKVQLTTIATILKLCSPETLYIKARVKSGVLQALSKALGITKSAVSRKIESAIHYYSYVSAIRNDVESIVSEVKNEKEID